MKLIYRILYRLSIALLLVLGIWGAFFYLTVIDEINDETDDSLEDYSEIIIRKALTGQELPSRSNGSNNTYSLNPVSEEYARIHKKIRYSDEMIYIEEKEETEPARILKTIFRDKEENYFELTVCIPTIEKEDLQEAILSWIVFLYTITHHPINQHLGFLSEHAPPVSLTTLAGPLHHWFFHTASRQPY